MVGDDGISRSAIWLLSAAARVRAVLHARHETRLRSALHSWAAAAAGLAAAPPRARSSGSDLLELVLSKMRPATLHWALGEWARAAAVAAADRARLAHGASLREGKFALQRTVELEAQARSRLVNGVLRWWQHRDLAGGWAQWRAAAAAMRAAAVPAASPHVRVSLG